MLVLEVLFSPRFRSPEVFQNFGAPKYNCSVLFILFSADEKANRKISGESKLDHEYLPSVTQTDILTL